MKRLILCRHAKSSWKDLRLKDIDRPLNKRGKKNGPEMGRRLAARGIMPDMIIASPARRALKTAHLLAKALGFGKKNVTVRREVYAVSAEGLIDLVRGLDNGVDTVILVGHNPEMTVLANILGDFEVDNVPTCGLVAFDFAVDAWGEVATGMGNLVFFDYPRMGGESMGGENESDG